MADDDLIVWKPSSPDDCADEELTDIDCSAIGLGGGGGAGGGAGADGQRQPPSMQARSKDALIYPATKILTRRTTTVPTTTRYARNLTNKRLKLMSDDVSVSLRPRLSSPSVVFRDVHYVQSGSIIIHVQ